MIGMVGEVAVMDAAMARAVARLAIERAEELRRRDHVTLPPEVAEFLVKLRAFGATAGAAHREQREYVPQETMTTAAAAAVLDVNPRTISKWIAAGHLFRPRRGVVDAADVMALLRDRPVSAPNGPASAHAA